MTPANRQLVRNELRWVASCAVLGALVVGGIADVATASQTVEPYKLGALFGGMLGLLVSSH